MTEYKSKLEEILPCKELLFDGTPGFGRYAPFLGHAVAHPAKMNTRLTEYLILQFTKPGDLVLDPMSGSGQTGIIASLNSRDAVCVELEERFYSWQLKAKSEIEAAQTFTIKGKLKCVLGDARKLSSLLQSVDVVVTSPPYAEIIHSTGQTRERVVQLLREKGYPEKWIQAHYMGPQCQVKNEGYSANPENISNLAMGEIDAIITSPPYDEGTGHGRGKDTKLQDEKKLYLHGAGSYSNSKDNIGELKKETYLQAMLTVYSEMFSVLKPSGLAAVVVKPFIRNKQVVDLPYQTWLLMQKCGFELIGSYKLRLNTQSFWRVLYMKKHPEVPEIWHEYVLVCKKSENHLLACIQQSENKTK